VGTRPHYSELPVLIEPMIIGLQARWNRVSSLACFGFGVFMLLTLAGCSRRELAARPEATMEELNAALDTWVMVKGLPHSVSELTNFPALKGKQLPAAPVGKKLAIDAAKRQVVFVNDK